MKQVTYKITGKHFFIFLVALALLPFSSVLGSMAVSLSANVLPAENMAFTGKGYLNIADQRGYGDAVLTIPQSQIGSVCLEIIDMSQVSAIWSWEIDEYSHYVRVYRHYEYTKDEYRCIDAYGRLLRIVIRTYVRTNKQKTFILAYGEGAFFNGREFVSNRGVAPRSG